MDETRTDSNDAFQLTAGQRNFLWIMLVAMLLLRVLAMFMVPHTDTTEARYAEIARKMVETNDWITPQFDYGVPFWGKPPLHTWLSALGMKVFGVGEFGSRILIFLCGCGVLWLVYSWAARFRGKDHALSAVTALLGCGIFFVAFAAVMTDLVMLAGTTLSMVAFWNALHLEKARRRWGYLFFVGLAIGMLAKGPVAVVLTAIPIGGWVLLRNRWVDTWKRLPWVSGTLLALAIAGPWYFLAEQKTPGFLRYFIVGEHIERFLVKGWDGDLYGRGHAKARGMIWVLWILSVLPWTPFYLAPFARFRELSKKLRRGEGEWALYLLCWTVAPMLFFTMATNIIPTYVITGVPAGSLLAIELWSMASGRRTWASPLAARFYGGTLLTAFCVFLTGFLMISGLTGSETGRKSEKKLVAKVLEMGLEEPTALNYWPRRPYSAEFYSGGKARLLGSKEEIGDLLVDGRRDVLVVLQSCVRLVPKDLLEHFEERHVFGNEVLFVEKSDRQL